MKENSNKFEITEDFLRTKYVKEKLSITQLTKLTGRSNVYIVKKLKEFNIPKNTDLDSNIKHTDLINLISLEKFKELYLEKALTYEEIGNIFNCSRSQISHLNSRYFHIKRDKDEKKEFMLRKLEKSTGKNGIDAMNDLLTNARKKYKEYSGYNNPSQDPKVQKKRTNTFLKKYGVENPFQSCIIKNKIKLYYMHTYGNNITNPSQVQSIKDRTRRALRISNLKQNVKIENIDILLNSQKFKEFIVGLPEESRNYTVIGSLFNVDPTTISKYVKEYDLESLLVVKTGKSTYEKEITEYLKNIGVNNIKRNVKNILDDHKEIDIYLPDFNIGIEFNGDYWHSEAFLEQLYHQKKSLNGLEHGIFIYNIFEHEWNNSKLQNKIKNQLKNIILKQSIIIYARKCVLKEITKTEKKEFLNRYHLQSNDHSIIDLGLFYNSELVMVMTFCKARFTKDHDWELSRMCTKEGYTIIGGASKLFKYFLINFAKSNEKIVTYNDIGKSKGTVYQKLNFKKIAVSYPSYIWFGHHKTISRYKTRFKNEINLMHQNGYLRVFDCGNNVWSYTVN